MAASAGVSEQLAESLAAWHARRAPRHNAQTALALMYQNSGIKRRQRRMAYLLKRYRGMLCARKRQHGVWRVINVISAAYQ